MPKANTDSDQSPLETFELARLALRRKMFGAPVDSEKARTDMSKPKALKAKSDKSGRTTIVNARKQIEPKFRSTLRSLGLQATTNRACVWIEGKNAARFFDLALENDLVRFNQFRENVFVDAAARRKDG